MEIFYSVLQPEGSNIIYLCESTIFSRKFTAYHKDIFNKYFYSEYKRDTKISDDINSEILNLNGFIYGGLNNGTSNN
jgi:hypothetical protein